MKRQIINLCLVCVMAIMVLPVAAAEEKALYSTTFTDWTDAKAAQEESTVTQQTKYSHETLTFKLFDTQISSTNQNQGKFPNWTGGYLMCSKSDDPYVTTSALASITKVHFIHGATGSKRGWKLEAKGDGDADWVVLSDAVATTATGTEVTVDVNRTNCQLRFTNLTNNQNAYLFQLDIYGNVDMSKTPTLGTFKANGTTYTAADIFNEEADGTMAATIELSKSASMISESNPLTDIVADNGEVKSTTYTTTGEGSAQQTAVAITVATNGDEVTYKATFVFKPDFTLTYYNTDGSKLGTQAVEKDATIASFQYAEKDVTVADGKAFRGWFVKADGGRKYTTDEVITADASLYAVATDIETQSTTARYAYNLTDPYFYAEDHEAFNPEGTGKYHNNQHGWAFSATDKLNLLVGGNAYIIVSNCRYTGGTITLTDAAGNTVGTTEAPANDGATASFYYTGDATTLTLSFAATTYLHNLQIINVAANPIAKGDNGYYVVKAGDADNLLSTIAVANANASDDARTYIFVPDGTYDIGKTVLTPISGNNITIAGQSMEKTIIKNAPDVANEGIGTTATFLITGKNTYLQDLTLQNALDYYSTGSAGRAVVIQDKGERTIYKNVKMLSYQDTYYSNAAKQFYFEDSEIHGNVDYLCGDGDVMWNRCTLVNESRKSGSKSGGATIAAPYTSDACTWGYVMLNCTIDNNAANFNYGRAWGGTPRLAYINTVLKQPTEIVDTRFTTAGMNVPADKFYEYNTLDANGNVVSPASNVLTFTKDKQSNKMETILTADEAAKYTVTNMFGDWAPDQKCAQIDSTDATLNGTTLKWEAADSAQAYAIFADDALVAIVDAATTNYTVSDATKTYTVRAANTMGGFGPAAKAKVVTDGIRDITTANNSQAPVVYFRADGTRIATPARGLNIRLMTTTDGKQHAEKIIKH